MCLGRAGVDSNNLADLHDLEALWASRLENLSVGDGGFDVVGAGIDILGAVGMVEVVGGWCAVQS
jgi:hypothetical protein